MTSEDLRRAGLKVTLPRLKIMKILENTEEKHLRAEDVYKILLAAGEEVGLATVYRVLTQFEAAGIVRRHHFDGNHALFELERGHHHDHVLCVHCGTVEEFMNEEIESLQQTVAEKLGYQLTDHSMTLYGLCAKCR
jgi:Fur family ferric uptake transcriptional regulator